MPRSTTGAALAVPVMECRNPACFVWGEPAPTDAGQDCPKCGWQYAPVNADDVAVRTADGDWALVDPQEVIRRGRELPVRALAVRLRVQALGHADPDTNASEPCVCLNGHPTFQFGPLDVTDDGLCRYCYGAGRIDVKLARTWSQQNG